MTQPNPSLSRRTVLRTVVGATIVSVAGCLNDNNRPETPNNGTTTPAGHGPLTRIAVEGTTLVLELSEEANIDQVNLIQPNGEIFDERDVATGAQQVSFEIGTTYAPGEYRVLALKGDETVAETSFTIQPDLVIRDVGLYRNHPNKPWDEIFGESQTDSKKNGEAFVTIENTGSGPEAVVELRFTEDIPNPVDNPSGSGIYEKERVVVGVGNTVDLFSDSFPFGSEIGKDGMGCSTDGNSGQFTVILETRTTGQQVTKPYDVEYTGSDEMQNCEVTISED